MKKIVVLASNCKLSWSTKITKTNKLNLPKTYIYKNIQNKLSNPHKKY